MADSKRRSGPIQAAPHVLPVVVVVKVDLDRLHEVFDGRRLAVARSVYLALVERCGDGVEFTRADLASSAGVTRKTLDEYVPAFEAAGLLNVERRREGPVNLPNLWRLVSVQQLPQAEVRECVYCGAEPDTIDHVVPDGGRRGNLVPACRSCNSSKGRRDVREWIELGGRRAWPEVAAALAAMGVRGVPGVGDDPEQSSTSPRGADEEGSGRTACVPLLDVAPLLTTDLIEDAEALIERKTKVDGRMVTAEEMAIAAVAVAEFNRQSGSEFGLGAHVRAIVGRVRERPSYTPDAHVRLVQSAWRLRWWERSGRGRRATPAVIYGNAGVFEQVVQDAVDEKKGVVRSDDNGGASRYDRED